MNVRVFPACAVLLLWTTTAQAQACLGLASLETRPMNLTVGARFADGVSGGEARFGFGTAKAFGGVSGAFVKADGLSGTTKGAGVDGGLSFPLAGNPSAMLCPVAAVDYLKSPSYDDGEGGSVDASALGTSVGLAIGGMIKSASGIGFIPFASVRAEYSRVSVSASGFSETESDTYGILAGGVSFVFNPSILVRPFIQFPFGVDDADPAYGVGFSFGFGKR